MSAFLGTARRRCHQHQHQHSEKRGKVGHVRMIPWEAPIRMPRETSTDCPAGTNPFVSMTEENRVFFNPTSRLTRRHLTKLQ